MNSLLNVTLLSDPNVRLPKSDLLRQSPVVVHVSEQDEVSVLLLCRNGKLHH